jgi:hypothetical protein
VPEEVDMFNQEELRSHLRIAASVGTAVVASLVLYLVLVEVLRAVYRPFRGFVATNDIQPIRVLRPRLLRMEPQADSKAVLIRLQRTAILTMVLGEIPSILGLGLFLVTGSNVDFYVLLFASLLLVFMYFPRRTAWEEWSSK